MFGDLVRLTIERVGVEHQKRAAVLLDDAKRRADVVRCLAEPRSQPRVGQQARERLAQGHLPGSRHGRIPEVAEPEPSPQYRVDVLFRRRPGQVEGARVGIDEAVERCAFFQQAPEERRGCVQRIQFLTRLREQHAFVAEDEQTHITRRFQGLQGSATRAEPEASATVPLNMDRPRATSSSLQDDGAANTRARGVARVNTRRTSDSCSSNTGPGALSAPSSTPRRFEAGRPYANRFGRAMPRD